MFGTYLYFKKKKGGCCLYNIQINIVIFLLAKSGNPGRGVNGQYLWGGSEEKKSPSSCRAGWLGHQGRKSSELG